MWPNCEPLEAGFTTDDITSWSVASVDITGTRCVAEALAQVDTSGPDFWVLAPQKQGSLVTWVTGGTFERSFVNSCTWLGPCEQLMICTAVRGRLSLSGLWYSELLRVRRHI